MFEAVFTKNLVQPSVKRFGDNWSPQYLSYADSAELKDSVDPDPVMATLTAAPLARLICSIAAWSSRTILS